MSEFSRLPVKVKVTGARGPSFADIARRTGAFDTLPTDNDTAAMNKFADYAITENAGFQSTIPGPAGPTYVTLATFRAAPSSNRKQALKVPGIAPGDFYFETTSPPYVDDGVSVIKANDTALTVGAWVRQSGASITVKQAGSGTTAIDAQRKSQQLVAGIDFVGVIGDGIADDTAALTAALVKAFDLGRSIHLPGRYLVSELKFPGTPALVSRYLEITGEPTFIQAVPNKRVLMIQDSVLQQSAGHRFSCTVVPHVDSDKADANNIACDLTGFSTSRIRVRLGVASAYTSAKGRFNTVVFARSNSPFNYGNHIDYIANSVPAPKYGVRFGNGGSGVAGNPNINTLRAWCVALDTVVGDVLIDVGDSTQTIIEGPTLLEGCPNALGIKAGNLSSIRDVWFELIGSDIDFTNTASTVPNNCSVERCYFSGGGHTVRIANDLAAPPMFEGCVNDQLVTYIDQGGSPIGRPAYTRGYAQPQSPVLTRMSGPALTLTPDENTTRLRVDHHGHTSFFLRYIATPAAAGESVLTLTPPTGFAIETATFGVRDTTTGKGIAFGLGDNPNCQNYGGYFDTINAHAVNINVTLRATS